MSSLAFESASYIRCIPLPFPTVYSDVYLESTLIFGSFASFRITRSFSRSSRLATFTKFSSKSE